MARDFNQNRVTNAKLGQLVGEQAIKKAGTIYATTYGYDGITKMVVEFPDFLKDFIQGNQSTTEYFVPNNVTEIRPYAFSGFPNLNNLTILNENQMVVINSNAMSGTKIGNKESGSVIYVVDTYYENYVSSYGELYNFASFVGETWFVVNYEKVGTSILTKDLLNNLDIPLTYSGIVIASNISHVTSISVSELDNITQIWLKECGDLIFDLDELPNGWVFDNGILYVSKNDYDTFIAEHSGYENYIESGYTLNIVGGGVLTANIVENAIDELELNEVPNDIINTANVSSNYVGVLDVFNNNDFNDIPDLDTLMYNSNTYKLIELENGIYQREYVETETGNATLTIGDTSNINHKIEFNFYLREPLSSIQNYTNIISNGSVPNTQFRKATGNIVQAFFRGMNYQSEAFRGVRDFKLIFSLSSTNTQDNYLKVNNIDIFTNANVGNSDINWNIVPNAKQNISMFRIINLNDQSEINNYVPAYNSILGKACLYDKVTHTYLLPTSGTLNDYGKWIVQ